MTILEQALAELAGRRDRATDLPEKNALSAAFTTLELVVGSYPEPIVLQAIMGIGGVPDAAPLSTEPLSDNHVGTPEPDATPET